jgi:hypothetical protein
LRGRQPSNAQDRSGKGETLRSPPPLRTERATFTALGSSLDKAPRSTRGSSGVWQRRLTETPTPLVAFTIRVCNRLT